MSALPGRSLVASGRPPVDRQEFTRRVTENATGKQLAAEFGISPARVSQLCLKWDLCGVRKSRRREYPLRWPQLRDREWLAAQLATRTIKDVAAELGCSRQTVAHHSMRLRDDQRPPRVKPARRERSADITARLCQLRSEGQTINQIAATSGLPVGAVRYRLRAAGVVTTDRQLAIAPGQLADRLAAGETLTAIAADVGISVSWLSRVAASHGISVPKRQSLLTQMGNREHDLRQQLAQLEAENARLRARLAAAVGAA